MMYELQQNTKFDIDQLVAASDAARNFSALRKNAKIAPRLILENNRPDSVILSIEDYQKMQDFIAALQEEIFDLKVASRIENAQINGVTTHTFADFATQEDKNIVSEAEKWNISDEDLFE